MNIQKFAKTVFHRLTASFATLYRGGGISGHYDNASTTIENRRHWENARDLAPIQVNNPDTRKRLRARARYECDNNCYAGGLVSTLATDTIGYVAPTPQFLTGNNELNKFLEQEWKTWSESEAVNLPEKLYIMDMSRYTDGEAFVLFTSDTGETESQTGYALNLTIIPQARVCDPNYNNYTNVETREININVGGAEPVSMYVDLINDDGVILNALTGKPYEYKVMNIIDEVQGYSYGLIGSNVQTVSARYMKHWFRPKRPGQFRGVCEIAASLNLYAQLRRFGIATLSAAEVAAMMSLVITTTSPVDGEHVPVTPFSTRDFERNMVTAMPEGWTASQMKAEHPLSSYEMFVNMVLREIGRLLDVPFGIVAGDHSKYNYSSARLDVTGYDERKKFDRKQLAIRILNPLCYEWLIEVANRRPDVAEALRKNQIKYNWAFTNRPSIAPDVDAKVEDTRLKNGTTTYSEVYAARGLDYREQFEQRQKEDTDMEQLGLDFSEQPVQQVQQNNPENN